MPHNRPERESEIRERYEFVVFDGEWSSVHAILAVIDGFYTGGSITWEVVSSEMTELFGDVATKMIEAGLDPTIEPIYVDKMIFETWEEPLHGWIVPLPNKFVPYVAARKKGGATEQDGATHSQWLEPVLAIMMEQSKS